MGLFDSCALIQNSTKLIELTYITKTAIANEPLYSAVERQTGIPWPVVAAIHYRESDQSFKYHLHNGDPLTGRTIQIPIGRPVKGNPPFTWIESAVDALTGFWHPFEWDVGGMLEFCERYNGLGYQKHGIHSPYLWACTDAYSTGLFDHDGHINLNEHDSRPGVAAIFKTMISLGRISLDFTQALAPADALH